MPVRTTRLLPFRFVVALLLAAGAATASGQDASISDALRSLASRAGVAFSGEVIAIRRNQSTVEIDFSVEQPVVGAPSGTYTLREWSGLWAAGQRRYWVGERAVVFLRKPSQGGISSSVDGMDGVLLLKGVPGGGEQQASVERLRARVQRVVGEALPQGASTIAISELQTIVAPPDAGVSNPPRIPVHPILNLPANRPAAADISAEPKPELPTESNFAPR